MTYKPRLACGSGFYTYSFLEWGASSVLGVDISSVMIDSAQTSQNDQGISKAKDERVSFIQADCSIPTSYPGSPFDIVFGAWLLNYAPDRSGLLNMFRIISQNLKPGGHFVSITVPPSSNPMESINAEITARPMPAGSGYLVYQPIREVDDGVFFNVHGETPVGDLDFENFHLRREVYEEVAREAGLKGELRWGVTEVPERWLRGEGEGGASLEELETYGKVPNYGVLVVVK